MGTVVTTQVARSEPFDNSTNGFVATDSQTAIEEAKTTAIGKIRFTLPFSMNSSVGNGNFISISELVPNHKYILTVPCKMVAISWSNTNLNVDFDLKFYKNGTAAGNLYRTYQVRNDADGYAYEAGWGDSFVAGDYFRVEYIDQGDNVSDFSGFFWMEVI